MPYHEADESDPMLLVGVEIEAGRASTVESARVFAEEFARMGFDEETLMSIFRNPSYAAPHRALLALGEEEVRALLREQTRVWSNVRFLERDTDPDSGMVVLPVL